MRIVLDTNVVVSSFLSDQGNPFACVEAVRSGKAELWISVGIRDEYVEVLTRPHWPFAPSTALCALDGILSRAILVNPPALKLTLPDSKDLIFVETAYAARASLVTGNRRHFPRAAVGPLDVLSPRELVERLRGGKAR